MTMQRIVVLGIAVSGLAVSLGAGSASAAVIYRQDFDSSAASGNTPITTGTTWHLQGGSTTVPKDVTPTAVGNYFGGISVDAAAPSNGGNTDGTGGTIVAPAQGNTAGRVFYNTGNTGVHNAMLYTLTPVDPAAFTVTGISWWARNNSTGTVGGSRAALEIGGQWYAGSTLNNASAWTQATIALDTETWIPFSFTPDTVLTQTLTGTPGPLPAGAIDAFGLYLQAGTTDGSLTRADGFTLTGTSVPEPGIAALTVPLMIAGLRRRR